MIDLLNFKVISVITPTKNKIIFFVKVPMIESLQMEGNGMTIEEFF